MVTRCVTSRCHADAVAGSAYCRVCLTPQQVEVKPADVQKAAKVPVWQGVFSYFSNALQAVGAVSRMGAAKHNNGNMPTKWREYPLDVYSDALARHITEEGKGNLYDSESHMLHAAHAAWNALARLEKLLEHHKLTLSQVIDIDSAQKQINPDYITAEDIGRKFRGY